MNEVTAFLISLKGVAFFIEVSYYECIREKICQFIYSSANSALFPKVKMKQAKFVKSVKSEIG